MFTLDPHIGPFLLALLALVVLAAVVGAARAPESPRNHWLLLFGVVVFPGMTLLLGAERAMDDAKRPSFCGSCHVMQHWANDLVDPQSKTLAAVHYQNRYILEDQCYTCHSDYTMFGPLQAKLGGMRHLWYYATGTYKLPLKIREPYHIANCLHCHGEAKVFRDAHPDIDDQIEAGMSCLDCHSPVHPDQPGEGKTGEATQ